MGQGTLKKNRRALKKTAREVYSKQHLEIIRGYIDGIIDLPFKKRLKVCIAIFKKRNPFGNSPDKKGGK